MDSSSRRERYPGAIIALHWLTLVLIIVSYVAMEAHEGYPRGSAERAFALSIHYQTGLTVLVLTMARIALRLATYPAPPIVPAPPLWQERVSRVAHFALYALLIVQPFLGWAAVNADGETARFLGIALPALVEPGKILSGQLEEVHEIAGNALYILVFVHAAAALAHHFYWRDNTLKRMGAG